MLLTSSKIDSIRAFINDIQQQYAVLFWAQFTSQVRPLWKTTVHFIPALMQLFEQKVGFTLNHVSIERLEESLLRSKQQLIQLETFALSVMTLLTTAIPVASFVFWFVEDVQPNTNTTTKTIPTSTQYFMIILRNFKYKNHTPGAGFEPAHGRAKLALKASPLTAWVTRHKY